MFPMFPSGKAKGCGIRNLEKVQSVYRNLCEEAGVDPEPVMRAHYLPQQKELMGRARCVIEEEEKLQQ